MFWGDTSLSMYDMRIAILLFNLCQNNFVYYYVNIYWLEKSFNIFIPGFEWVDTSMWWKMSVISEMSLLVFLPS